MNPTCLFQNGNSYIIVVIPGITCMALIKLYLAIPRMLTFIQCVVIPGINLYGIVMKCEND